MYPLRPSNSDPSSSSASASKSASSRMFSAFRRSLGSSKSAKEREEDIDQHAHPPRSSSRSRYRDASRPTVEQIAMGLHLSRTPHLPPHLSHLPHQHQHHRAPPSPSSSSFQHSPRPSYSSRRHSQPYFRSRADSTAQPAPFESSSTLHRFPSVSPSLSSSPSRHAHSPSRRRSRMNPLPPPPTRSALKKSTASTKSGSLTTLDTAVSASSAASSTAPPTPTFALSALPGKLRLSRFLPLRSGGSLEGMGVTSSEESVSEPARKAVRFEETATQPIAVHV
ncbi:hypothetical protein HETIRDRAFT_324139 [Heterobasidion irregulare TC 32-1]|uniref:Uncharacterized protein n=1 Tax=Heterobasidion irregulare (strain TC 32-1) TaxID=747525 RepID=W4K0E7_HETIT|nr:uncharacterized protein HETIRDRAFT_324139 [Heterobasidion irregulare TC 32-1]ETW79219.1 hypothetical protein HETIRDRAFT_324139 [Heterobasidion irregulare TC 32-1]